MVAGDAVVLNIEIGVGCTVGILTQASTKIYKSHSGKQTKQQIQCKILEGGCLVYLPDPVTCFENAIYSQQQTFYVHKNANLVMLDWLTSGRSARGEVWCFQSYKSQNDIFLYDERSCPLLVHDTVNLEQNEIIPVISRMGGYNVIAMLVLLGPQLKCIVDNISKMVREITVNSSGFKPQPSEKTSEFQSYYNSDLLCTFSPLEGPCDQLMSSGAILRIAGKNTELVQQFLQYTLKDLTQFLGSDPWQHKR